MAGAQFLWTWFKNEKSKAKMEKNKKSEKGEKAQSHKMFKNSPPTHTCLCRAAMTLPPTPEDLARRDGSLVWGRSCVDSPPHLYEEIPDPSQAGGTPCCSAASCCTLYSLHQGSYQAHQQSQEQNTEENHEYLKPTQQGRSITLDDILKKHGLITNSLGPSVELCKYDKISPLSALGLTMASLKKCRRCQRPHGVYNGTIYHHGGSNSSPDLVSLDRQSLSPFYDQAKLPEDAKSNETAQPLRLPRFYSTNDLCSQEYERPYAYRFRNHGCKANENAAESPVKESSFTAFQVLKPSGHRQLAELVPRQQILPSSPGDVTSEDYEYYLLRAKRAFELGISVQDISRNLEEKNPEDSQTGKMNSQACQQAKRMPFLNRKHDVSFSNETTLSQNMSHSMTDLINSQSGYTPLIPNVVPERPSLEQKHFHTMSSPSRSKPQLSVVQNSPETIDKLSCRATNFSFNERTPGCYGSQQLLRESNVHERGIYGYYGNVQRTNHNPLLSDIMRRNHDRQNLVI